jgi:hypothetical protein
MIPISLRKDESAGSNDSCSGHSIDENHMGNRGSKSTLLPFSSLMKGRRMTNSFVKEQRADGSWFEKSNLRCALGIFERNFCLKTPSSLYFRKYFSTFLSDSYNFLYDSSSEFFKLDPWFVTIKNIIFY